jgi:hypothetical protein
VWRTRCNSELYTLYDQLDTFWMIKVGRLRWLGHLFIMQELDPCRKLTQLKPEGTRSVGKPKLRWFESVEGGLKNMDLRKLRGICRIEKGGGQLWKRMRSTKDCNSSGRRRVQFCLPSVHSIVFYSWSCSPYY